MIGKAIQAGFNNKTVIGTLPAYFLILVSYISLVAPANDRYEYVAALISLFASTEFLSVSFCYLFTISAYDVSTVKEKCHGELLSAILVLVVAFIFFKLNPISVGKVMDWDKYGEARFSVLMPISSVLSIIYTLTFYKRLCKE